MKFYFIILFAIVLVSINSCNPTNSFQLSSMSKDSIYISQNLLWEIADTNHSSLYGKGGRVCIVDLIKIDKNIFLHLKASALKTDDDSLHLFVPPEKGGELVVGKFSGGQIQSEAKGFDRKKVEWITNHSFKIDSIVYDRLYKIDMGWFKHVLVEYTYLRGKDSLEIILAGP